MNAAVESAHQTFVRDWPGDLIAFSPAVLLKAKKVVPLGDVAVTSYRFVVTIKGERIDVSRHYRATNAWTKIQGRWQVVAAHTAFVFDPKQAARLASDPG